jgi:hypothetical protein
LKEFTTFTTLKKRLTILTFILGLSVVSFAQLRPASPVDNGVKVVKFYPNPATSAINFELSKGYDKSFTLQLFNFMGRKVFETTPGTQRLFISLDRFFRGVYIYQLRDKYGKITDSGKFQVVK